MIHSEHIGGRAGKKPSAREPARAIGSISVIFPQILSKLSKFSEINHGFFNKKGGVSKGIYKSLNCGPGSRDKPSNVRKNLELVNIDPINKGPYLLETLKVDKNSNKTDALNDIYKVLRPGEAPSLEIAEEIFNNLYFKKERYDLSEVGRVKLNSKLNLNISNKKTILSTDDIVAIIQFMLDLRTEKV